jgi:hypothetical protein
MTSITPSVAQVSGVADWREVMKRPPDHTHPDAFNYWLVFMEGDISIALAEQWGPLAPHKHPAIHWATILEGEAQAVIGDQYYEIGERDTIRVDKGVPHVVVPRPGTRILAYELLMPHDIIAETDFLSSGPEFEIIDALQREHGMMILDYSTQNANPLA